MITELLKKIENIDCKEYFKAPRNTCWQLNK